MPAETGCCLRWPWDVLTSGQDTPGPAAARLGFVELRKILVKPTEGAGRVEELLEEGQLGA